MRYRFTILGTAAMAVWIAVGAAPARADGWRFGPTAGLFIPLSADVEKPDPTYELGLAAQKAHWRIAFAYAAGDGRAEDGWDSGISFASRVPGAYDYFMAGLTVSYVLGATSEDGWFGSIGAGPWFEHTEYKADRFAPAVTHASVIVDVETEQLLLCGEGGLGYRVSRAQFTATARVFLGSENITSAITVGAGLLF